MIDLKSPWVIGGGVLVGAILLLSRSSNSSNVAAVDPTSAALSAYNTQAQTAVAMAQANSPAQVAQINGQYAVALQQEANNGVLANGLGQVVQTAVAENAGIVNNIISSQTQNQLAFTNAQQNIVVTGLNTRAGVEVAKVQAQIAQMNDQTAQAIATTQANAAQNASSNNLLGNIFGNLISTGGSLAGKAIA